MHLRTLAILVATMLAGCADGGSHDDGDDPFQAIPQEPVAAGKGVIRGIVVDGAILPVVGAKVVLLSTQAEARADDNGAFVFSNVDPGTYFLQASKPGYASVQQSVEVKAGVEKPPIVKIMMERMPGTEPRAETYTAEGFIACGIGTPATFHVCPGLSEDKSTITIAFAGTPDWIQVETTWESTQAAGEQLYLVYYYCTDNCGARQGRWSEGNRDDPWIARTENTRTDEQVAVYASPGGPANGTGVALDQPFYTYATFFYNIEPEEGWSFLESGQYQVPP